MTDSLIHRFHQCLNPDLLLQLAKDSGWCQRLRKIHPFEFLYSLVFGQLSAVHCTLNAQAQSLTLPVFRQAVDQRYTPAAVAYFQAAFTHTLNLTLQDQSPTPLAQFSSPTSPPCGSLTARSWSVTRAWPHSFQPVADAPPPLASRCS